MRLVGIILLLVDIFNRIQGHDMTVGGVIVFTGGRWDVVCAEVVITDMLGSCGIFAEKESLQPIQGHTRGWRGSLLGR